MNMDQNEKDALNASKTIFRQVRKNGNYVQIDNGTVADPRLSFKAKGVLAYLLSRPPDWRVMLCDLRSHSTDGETAINSAMDELKEFGYVQTKLIRCQETGQLKGRVFTVFEVPFTERVVSRPSVNRTFGKPRATNTDKTKTENKTNSAFPNSRCSSEAAGVLNGEEMPPIKWVNQLKAHLKKSHVFQISLFNEKRWCHHFKKLLVDLDGNANRISRVMDRYVSKQADYRPSVYDAFGFRKNFGKIEKWTNDGRPFVPKREVVEIKGTKRVMKKGQTILDIDPTYDG